MYRIEPLPQSSAGAIGVEEPHIGKQSAHDVRIHVHRGQSTLWEVEIYKGYVTVSGYGQLPSAAKKLASDLSSFLPSESQVSRHRINSAQNVSLLRNTTVANTRDSGETFSIKTELLRLTCIKFF